MVNDEKENFNSDYEYSRETLYDLIEKGREGIEEMIEVARNSEHPRAYEVLSKLIKDVGDVSDKLMQLNKAHKDLHNYEGLYAPHKDLHKEEQQKLENKTTNNIFVGSTTELQRFLLGREERDITPSAEE